jgi:hypothetical protein
MFAFIQLPRWVAGPMDGGIMSRWPGIIGLVVLLGGGGCGGSSGGGGAPALAGPTSAGPAVGARALLDKRFDEVAFVTTHNAYNYDGPFTFPNQSFSVTRQLQDGVRGLMIDVHEYTGIDPSLMGVPHVYHGTSILGSQPLSSVYQEIRGFLVSDPRAVVTIILENTVALAALDQALSSSGLAAFVHEQPAGQPWPTLQEMITRDTRLVILNDTRDPSGQFSWSHYAWDFAVETGFSNHSLADFHNSFNRGDASNDLFILNHFLTDTLAGLGSTNLSHQANDPTVIRDRVLDAFSDTGKVPNFVTVDFYELGGVFAAVDAVNALVP